MHLESERPGGIRYNLLGFTNIVQPKRLYRILWITENDRFNYFCTRRFINSYYLMPIAAFLESNFFFLDTWHYYLYFLEHISFINNPLNFFYGFMGKTTA